MNFEGNLKKLEELVAGMESGDMKLDDMIKSFEEGRRLVDACRKDLESIRQRIEKVTRTGEVEEMNAQLSDLIAKHNLKGLELRRIKNTANIQKKD